MPDVDATVLLTISRLSLEAHRGKCGLDDVPGWSHVWRMEIVGPGGAQLRAELTPTYDDAPMKVAVAAMDWLLSGALEWATGMTESLDQAAYAAPPVGMVLIAESGGHGPLYIREMLIGLRQHRTLHRGEDHLIKLERTDD